MKKAKKQFGIFLKGFTLIELLVVIAIIGSLAATLGVLIKPGAQLAKARDTKRKSDLKQYRALLESFANKNNGFYPGRSGAGVPAATTLCTDLAISDCPKDPNDPTGVYYYQSDTNSGVTPANAVRYTLWATLEKETNPLWVVCSNGMTGESFSVPSGGNCPIAATTPTLTPTSPPATNTPTPSGPTATPTLTPTPIPGGNLLVNPGFESGSTGWSGVTTGITIVTYAFHTGIQSLQIDEPTSGTRGVYQNVTVIAGRSYTISGWIQANLSTGNPRIVVNWKDSSGTQLSTTIVANVTSTSGWTQYSINVSAPAGAVTAMFQCYLAAGTGGSAWFDDLVLQ